MADPFAVVHVPDVPEEPFPESGRAHRKLTERLGCTEMRVNAVTLGPGESTAAHAHERQEEVYVALDGGVVVVGASRHELAPGDLVRLGPDAVRHVHNPTDDREQTWLLFGAPPVGTVDDYGEYSMPEG